MQEGIDGLLRDKTRPPRIPPLSQSVIDRVAASSSRPPSTASSRRPIMRPSPISGSPIPTTSSLPSIEGAKPWRREH